MPTNFINITEVILNGIVFDPKKSEVLRAMDAQELVGAVQRLFELLEQRRIDYLLVGGVAMLVYVDGRNTQDIDLIIDADALNALPEIEIEDQNVDFARAHFGGLQVNLLLTRNPLFHRVRRDFAATRHFAERDIPCATVEGLFLLKTFALPAMYRQGQFNRVEIYEHDLAMLIRDHQLDLSALFDILEQHVSASDLREIREIVAEMERRIVRAPTRFRTGDSSAG